MASSSTSRPESRALVTHIKPKRSIWERTPREETDDEILGPSGLEDIVDPFSRQSLVDSTGADPTEIANLSENQNGGICPDIRQLPTWDKIDHVGKACILRILSEKHRSFQKACKLLFLEPVEAESFLRQHGEIIQTLDEFHGSSQERARGHGQRPGTYSCRQKVGIFIRPSTIELACKYLGYLGLNYVSNVIRHRTGCQIQWPLDIDASDFNPLELGTTGPTLPHTASTPPDKSALPSDASTSLSDDCRVLVAFSATEVRKRKVRVHSILIPAGAIIVGPAGAKTMIFEGRYHIISPSKFWDLRGPDVHEFLICENQAPPPSQSAERLRQHGSDGGQRLQGLGDIAEETTPRESSDRDIWKERHMGEEIEMFAPGTPPPLVVPGAAATHAGSPSDVQGDVPDVERDSPEPQFLMKSPRSKTLLAELNTGWLPDDCPLINARAGSAASKALDIHYYVSGSNHAASQPEPRSRPHQSRFDLSSYSRHGLFQAVGTEGANTQLRNWIIEDGLPVPLFDTTKHQQQGPQNINGMPYIQSTIPGMSVLRKPAVKPQPAPFHANDNIFGPLRKDRTSALEAIANECSPRMILQFRLPTRYVVKSPTGLVMNFDDAWNGPGDGRSGGGLGGVYTVILPDPQAVFGEEPAPLPPIPELKDHVHLRVNLAQRMAVIKDSHLLPRLTEQGLHEMSTICTKDGYRLDLLCENGRYRVFEGMTPADDGMLLLNRHQNMSSVFEPDEGSNGQHRGSSTTHPTWRVSPSNAEADTQVGKRKTMDIDGEVEDLDGKQDRENKHRKLGHPRSSTTESEQAKGTTQRKLFTSPVGHGNGKGTEAGWKPEMKKSKAPRTITTGQAWNDALNEKKPTFNNCNANTDTRTATPTPNGVVLTPQGVPKASTQRRSGRLAVETRTNGPATASRSSKRMAECSTAKPAVPTPKSQASISEPPRGLFKRPHSIPAQPDGTHKRLRTDDEHKPKPQSKAHKTRARNRIVLPDSPANAAEEVQPEGATTVPGRGRGKNVPDILAQGLLSYRPRSKNRATDSDESEYANEDEAGADSSDATDVEDSDMEDLGSN